MDKNKIYKFFQTFDNHTDDYPGAMFIKLFDELPYCYRFFYNENNELSYTNTKEPYNREKQINCPKIDVRKLLNNLIIGQYAGNYEVFVYSSLEYLICGEDPVPFLINITLTLDSDATALCHEIYVKRDCINEVFNSILVPNCEIAQKTNTCEFGIASIVEGTNSLYTSYYDYEVNVDDSIIENNYNDDLPYDRICDILADNSKPSLILFYGEPGTGKTTLIKHLIGKYIDKEFIFVDGALLGCIPQEKLMQYFMDNMDTVFILEDCEKILTDRDSGYNPVMPVLLNITDGIVGDVIKPKFICTFNSRISKIDKALLRKGRLSLKYEFKKLSKDKVNKILPGEDTDMTLADIYYKEQENDFSKIQKNKIGF